METKRSADWNAAFTRQKRLFEPCCRLEGGVPLAIKCADVNMNYHG